MVERHFESSSTPAKRTCGVYGTSEIPVIVAHRGSRYLNPENTVQALASALELGADVIEFDVRRSKNGTLFVMHDDTGVRLLRNQGFTIENSTDEEILQQDIGEFFSADSGGTYPCGGRGYGIPTFEDVLSKFNSVPMSVEIKEDDKQVAENVIALLDIYVNNTSDVIIASRYCGVIRHVRSISPKYSTVSCEGEAMLFVISVEIGLSNLFSYIFPPQYCALAVPVRSAGIELATYRFISASHQAGVKVGYWVVNNATEMDYLLSMGADGIITDRSDRAAKVFSNRYNRVYPRVPRESKTIHFTPHADPPEYHTCITAVCRILQDYGIRSLFFGLHALLLFTLSILVVVPISKKRRRHHKKVQ